MEKLSECDFTPRNLEPNVLAIVKKKKIHEKQNSRFKDTGNILLDVADVSNLFVNIETDDKSFKLY